MKFCRWITLVVLAGLFSACRSAPGADSESLAYVVNWAGFENSKIVEVVDHYESDVHPIQGDHSWVYCLRLEPIPTVADSSLPDIWHRGPIGDPVVVDALRTAAAFSDSEGGDWFPTFEQLNSDRFMLSFPQITAYNLRVEAVRLTALDLHTGLVYHFDVSW